MNRVVLALAAGVVFLMGALSISYGASTYDSFHCQNGNLVTLYDKIGEVAIRCDPPTFASKRTEVRHRESFEIEEWTYNLGSSSFIYTLSFVNGILTRIESGDHGY
jgi:hypothetical protein